MKRTKTKYSKEFKENVLSFYKEAGPKAASEAFGVDKSLLLAWRRTAGVDKFRSSSKSSELGKGITKRQYSIEFKLEVLNFFKENGEVATASKFNLNSNLIYKWRKDNSEARLANSSRFNKAQRKEVNVRDPDPPFLLKVEPFKKYSDDQKKEVLIFFGEHGREDTLKKYGIKPQRLSNWRKKFQNELAEVLPKRIKRISREETEFRMKVLDDADAVGIKAASEKYNVTLPTIWNWRSKMKELGKKDVKKPTKVTVARDENEKKKIVEFYLEKGAFACEKEFQVPRQTVRNWAIKHGYIDSFSSVGSLQKDTVVQHAKEVGVRSAISKYSVSRATLYNWSKLYEVSLTENQTDDYITVDVKKDKEVRRIIFYKKKPAKVKVPKVRKPPKPKVKKEKKSKAVLPENSPELPGWAKEFIKSNVPRMDKSVVLPENKTLFSNEVFSLSTGNILYVDEEIIKTDDPTDPKLEDLLAHHSMEIDVEESKEEEENVEYECEAVEKELFESFPFFFSS